jgi:hypothetical protein
LISLVPITTMTFWPTQKAAHERTVSVDHFSKRLSGIVQNVLDFDEQDSIEVQDSLSLSKRLGAEIAFVHARATVWFCGYRRAYFAGRDTIGRDPYWLLTRLVLGHNERLLIMLREELDHLDETGRGREAGILGVIDRLHAIRRRIDQYIRNPFRYPHERSIYDFISDARGLEQQLRLLEAEEQEGATRERERIDWRINMTLIGIGAIQAAGVLIAVLALQLSPLSYWESFSQRVLGIPKSVHGTEGDVVYHHPVPWLIFVAVAAVLLLGGLLALALFTLAQSRRSQRRRRVSPG